MARTNRAKERKAADTAKPKLPVKRSAPPREIKPTGLEAELAPSVPEPPAPATSEVAPAEARVASADVGPPPSAEPGSVGSETAPAVGTAAGDAEPPTAGPEPAATGADHAEPVTAAASAKPLPGGEAAPGGEANRPRPLAAPDLAAMFLAHRTLVEGSIRVRTQMIGFSCRQAEHGLAVSRALLASGSLPEAMSLQAKYLGQAVDDALAQTLELSRLSSDVLRTGLESLRQR
jgi:hypothetical protein